MKKIIAIAALIASAQASAFWGWNDSSGYQQGLADGAARGKAEADFSFDMSFSADFTGRGRGAGNGNGSGNGYGYGESAHIPYYAAPYGLLPTPAAPVN